MTNEELNKWLAEFMGWEKNYPLFDQGWRWYQVPDSDFIMRTVDWNPIEDRNQMAMCVEKIPKGISELRYYHSLIEICLNRKFQFVDTLNLHWTEGLTISKASPLQIAEALIKQWRSKICH